MYILYKSSNATYMGGGVSADIGEGKKCVAKDEEEQFGC